MNAAQVPSLARLCGDENAEPTRTVEVGDWVEFKCDVEQSGRITEIRYDTAGAVVLYLENPDGFSGEYLDGDRVTWQLASDCWK